jgi:hypothetical protein
LCPGGIAARAAVPDLTGWGGMAAQAGAGANLDPLVGPAAVVIRSLQAAPVALRLSKCSKAANGPRPGRQPRPASSRRSMVWSIQAETAKRRLTQRRSGKDLRSGYARRRFWVLAHVCPPTKDTGEKRIRHLAITLQEYDTLYIHILVTIYTEIDSVTGVSSLYFHVINPTTNSL